MLRDYTTKGLYICILDNRVIKSQQEKSESLVGGHKVCRGQRHISFKKMTSSKIKSLLFTRYHKTQNTIYLFLHFNPPPPQKIICFFLELYTN